MIHSDIVHDGHLSVQLGAGQSVRFFWLPKDLMYTVTERDCDCETRVIQSGAVVDGSTVDGCIELGDIQSVEFINEFLKPGTGRLEIRKQVVNGFGEPDELCRTPFQFLVKLSDGNGVPVSGTFVYEVYKDSVDNLQEDWPESYGTIGSGGTLTIGANQVAYIFDLPIGTAYEVQELSADAFSNGFSLVSSDNISGVLPDGVERAVFVNGYIADMPQLPSTGGIGVREIYFGGLAITGIGFVFCLMMGRCERKRMMAE